MFRALNSVEMVLVAAVVRGNVPAGVRPALNRRSDRVLAGETLPRSRAHGARTFGYEPRAEGDTVVLVNCPFHTLAQHTELVCDMNLRLVNGILDGATTTAELTARLAPKPGYCRVELVAQSSGP